MAVGCVQLQKKIWMLQLTMFVWLRSRFGNISTLVGCGLGGVRGYSSHPPRQASHLYLGVGVARFVNGAAVVSIAQRSCDISTFCVFVCVRVCVCVCVCVGGRGG